MVARPWHMRTDTVRLDLPGSEPTVAKAHELLGLMPNGWTLKSLEYDKQSKSWVAVAESPKVEVPRDA